MERQQTFLNNYVRDKLKAAFPSKYQEEQPEPQQKADSRARSKSSQKSARTQIVRKPQNIDDKLTVTQSGFFKIYIIKTTYDEFLGNQFGKVYDAQNNEILQPQEHFEELVRL